MRLIFGLMSAAALVLALVQAPSGRGENSPAVTSSAIAPDSAITPGMVVMQPDTDADIGRLPRELARQALLAVAREEFGFVARDVALGEVALEDNASEASIELRSRLGADSNSGTAFLIVDAETHAGRGGKGKESRIVAELPVGCVPPSFAQPWRGPGVGAGLEETAVAMVDTSQKFSDLLREQGFTSLAPTKAEPHPENALGDIRMQQRQMSLVPQFAAVRAAHALPPGAEKERLLAIGYANLGLLTQHLWSPASKIFAARSLVYAERAARAEPGAGGDEVRAYAAAMAGLHAAALKHAATVGADRSPRLTTIVAFCRFREHELLRLSQETPEVRELAAVLACIAAEPAHSLEVIAKTYKNVAELSPHALRAYDPAGRLGEIGLMHDVTERGPRVLMQQVPQQLRDVPGLSQAVREMVANETVAPCQLADLLESETASTGTLDEPSWPVLGRLLRDEALVVAHRRLLFLQRGLSVPRDGEYEPFRVLVGEHPLAEVALGPLSDAPDIQRIRESAAALRSEQLGESPKRSAWKPALDFGPRHWPLAANLQLMGLEELGAKFFSEMFTRGDQTFDDLSQLLIAEKAIGLKSPLGPDPIDALAAVSPHDPLHAIRAMTRMGASPPQQLSAWEEEFNDRPGVLPYLAHEYINAGRPRDALRVAKRAAELAPSFSSYYDLAKTCQEAGDEVGYVKALEKSLHYPSYGLGETNARIRLADYYMQRGNFKAAEPYATDAAESYSWFGLTCAVDCYTGLGAWDAAEQMAQRVAQRYPETSAAVWYAWCRRTGRGDVAAAKEFADGQYVSSADQQRPASQRNELSFYRFVEGRDREAAELRESVAREERNPAVALIAAVGFLRVGQRDHAVALLGEATRWTTSNPKAAGAARRAGLFRDALAERRPLAPEVAKLLADDIETFAKRERIGFRAYYGELMVRCGNLDEGLRLLTAAAEAKPDHFGDGAAPGHPAEIAFAMLWLHEHLADTNTGSRPSSQTSRQR